MQRPLREHIVFLIAYLERKIEGLKVQQDDAHFTAEERYQSSIDLTTAERALLQLRRANEPKQRISRHP